MSLEILKKSLSEKEAELAELRRDYEEYEEMSKKIETELEEEIEDLKSIIVKLKQDSSELADKNTEQKVIPKQLEFMAKSSSFEKTISLLSNEKSSLESKLAKMTKIARESEMELDKVKNTLREKEFEIEEVTSFYHQTLEDLALTCSELDDIKDTSSENMQRLKDQMSELSSELAAARRKSRGISQHLSMRCSTPFPFNFHGGNAITMVDSLISDLTKKLKGMPIM